MQNKCKLCGNVFDNCEIRGLKGKYIKKGKLFCSTKCKKETLKRLCKTNREKRWFSGLREHILKRDNYKCSICNRGENVKLFVHHKNGIGRGRKNPDNRPENLITVCCGCHSRIHHKIDREKLLEKYIQNKHLSNRKIAKILGITHPTVAILRKEIKLSDDIE